MLVPTVNGPIARHRARSAPVFDRSPRCAVTGRHKDWVPLRVRTHSSLELGRLGRGLGRGLGDALCSAVYASSFPPATAHHVWGQAGGPNVNSPENLMPLTAHHAHNARQAADVACPGAFRATAWTASLCGSGTTQEPGSHVTEVNGGWGVRGADGRVSYSRSTPVTAATGASMQSWTCSFTWLAFLTSPQAMEA